jgi:uncharacterized membrane protein (Fun14 family)
MKHKSTPTPQGKRTSVSQETSADSRDLSPPVPAPVRICASYVGGFFLGWAFRRVVYLILAVAAAALIIVGFGRLAGCDTVSAETKVKHGSSLVQQEAKAARDRLKAMLPSASAGAVGTFLGFRRKLRQDPAPQ